MATAVFGHQCDGMHQRMFHVHRVLMYTCIEREGRLSVTLGGFWRGYEGRIPPRSWILSEQRCLDRGIDSLKALICLDIIV